MNFETQTPRPEEDKNVNRKSYKFNSGAATTEFNYTGEENPVLKSSEAAEDPRDQQENPNFGELDDVMDAHYQKYQHRTAEEAGENNVEVYNLPEQAVINDTPEQTGQNTASETAEKSEGEKLKDSFENNKSTPQEQFGKEAVSAVMESPDGAGRTPYSYKKVGAGEAGSREAVENMGGTVVENQNPDLGELQPTPIDSKRTGEKEVPDEERLIPPSQAA